MSNSIRSAIRARFRGDREQSLGPGDCSDSSKNSSRECLHHNKDEQKLSAEAISILKDDEDEDHSVMIGVDGAHEKDVYELQLSQLQEQLVAAMIENQNLNNELDLFKGQNQVDRLLQELEEEKNNVKALQAAIDKVNSTDSKDVIPRGPSESDDMYSGWVDVAEEAEASETEEIGDLPASTASKNVTDRLTHSLMKVLLNFLSDFTDDPAPESIVTVEEEPLAVKKLKDNIKRFRHNTKPVFNTMKSLKHLFTWKNPSLTLIVFTIYMYSVWVGYLLPVLTFVILARLTINYLKERGWNINIVFLADIEDDEKDSEAFKDLGMSDKFNLVLQVAKQVQNTMGKLSDNLEKVKNLLTWKHPPATRRLFAALCIGFVLSCLMEGTLLFTLAALFFGIKMFVVQFLFVKFPRLKQRHDTTSKLWKELPTDAQLDKKYQKAATEVSSWYHHSTPTTSRRPSSTNSNTSHDLILKEHFNLPATETTIPGWQGGRRCTMIFKDKSLTSAFKNGRLYLTQSYLCFERVRSSSSKNVLIALSDITRVDKANPFVWMPGSGMSIEITLVNQEKPVLFGAMLYRDECYDSIMSQGANLLLSWATPSSPGGGGAGPSTPHTTDRKSSEAAAVMSSSAATL